jgi:hypothetical protein
VRAFDGNDYRRVLAAIDARGGVQTSDPFEQYDLPLDDVDRLRDRDVAAQVDAVWAFWQKQRDHPKYRGLVTALLARHGEVAPRLRDPAGRRRLADEARQARAQREQARGVPLDAAIARLVERFGGIPADKVAGLRRVAAAAGLDERTTQERLARHPLLDAAPPPPDYRQVRRDLDELGRLLGVEPPAGLYDLLGLPPGAPAEQVAHERAAASARNRELRPDRRRALVDDLLAAVTTLLVQGDPAAYLDAVADEVRARLRARVAMVVLVEDGLGTDDAAQLVAEAEAGGLDRPRALRVLADLAAESGVPLPAGLAGAPPTPAPDMPAAPRPPAGPRPPATPGAWQEPLSQARAALRAGRVLEAQQRLGEARELAGGTLPPLRVLDEQVAAVLVAARQRWAEVAAALAYGRPDAAVEGLEQLAATAVDLPGPDGGSVPDALAAARARLAQGAARRAAAQGLTGAERELALLEALELAPDDADLLAELRAVGVAPATGVRAEPAGSGVRVSWQASPSPGAVDYRVLGPDGRVLGTTRATELEVGRPAGRLPAYTVVARRAGVVSPPASSAAGDPPPAVPSLAALAMGARVRLVFPPPPTGRAEVRRLPAGAAPPPPGSVVADPERLGELVPPMGPGLAVDRPAGALVRYVVLTVDGVAVAGAAASWVDLEGMAGARVRHDRLCWQWPAGCEEAVLCWRADAPPLHAGDPAGASRPVTREEYDDEGGAELPAARPLHVAVFPAVRLDGELHPGSAAGAGARLHLGGS